MATKQKEITLTPSDSMEAIFKQEIASTSESKELEVGGEVAGMFSDYEEKIKQAMTEKVENITEFIFSDILKFEADKIEKVAKVIGTTIDIMKFEDTLPTEELRQVADAFYKICDWRYKQKEKSDWNITINANEVLRAKSRMVDLKMKLTKPLSYYKTLNDGFTINRRATRSATSVAIRQFSSDMDTNIKKMLTVADSENFGEMLSSKVHLGALTTEYIYNYLNQIDVNMKYVIEDMNTVVNQIKFDMRIGGMM